MLRGGRPAALSVGQLVRLCTSRSLSTSNCKLHKGTLRCIKSTLHPPDTHQQIHSHPQQTPLSFKRQSPDYSHTHSDNFGNFTLASYFLYVYSKTGGDIFPSVWRKEVADVRVYLQLIYTWLVVYLVNWQQEVTISQLYEKGVFLFVSSWSFLLYPLDETILEWHVPLWCVPDLCVPTLTKDRGIFSIVLIGVYLNL